MINQLIEQYHWHREDKTTYPAHSYETVLCHRRQRRAHKNQELQDVHRLHHSIEIGWLQRFLLSDLQILCNR